jgi:hypothetical protein
MVSGVRRLASGVEVDKEWRVSSGVSENEQFTGRDSTGAAGVKVAIAVSEDEAWKRGGAEGFQRHVEGETEDGSRGKILSGHELRAELR